MTSHKNGVEVLSSTKEGVRVKIRIEDEDWELEVAGTGGASYIASHRAPRSADILATGAYLRVRDAAYHQALNGQICDISA